MFNRVSGFNIGIAEELGLPAAIVLNELLFWSGKGQRGDGWVYKSYQEMMERLPIFAERTIRNAYEKLRKHGYIKTKVMKVDGNATFHYQVLKDSICRRGTAANTETREAAANAEPSLYTVNNQKTTNDTNVSLAPQGKPEINQALQDWQEETGIALTSNVKRNRFAASNLLKKHGAANVGKLLKLVGAAQLDQYAPRIADFCQLQAKLPDLLVWAKTKGVAAQKSEITNLDDYK